MTTNSIQSLYHHHHSTSLVKLQSSDTTPSPPSFLKPTTTTTNTSSLLLSISSSSSSSSSSSHSTTLFSISPTTSTPPSTSQTFTLDLLKHHLSAQDFRQADEETRRLLIVLAGEAAQKRGYVFFSEVQFIAEEDLKAIDELWRQHSDNRFGYSVQKRIWQQKANKDFTKFFIKVGWMKKLDTEVEQYNYRSFPNEFVWELNDDTPEGHLPLTNALRGTQLLTSIFNHPAFEAEEAEGNSSGGEEDKFDGGDKNGGLKGLRDGSKLLSKVFKPDYSF
ncbi:Tetrapyrrole-binding protein, chloroplastic [Turnera subulata]|uniref:Tetrapyrrole-binding protein, chloroplastic n=1 Tax=Turnera subulata TaxID=218843 RepID=A0A9Q0G5M0_9ROSI|nr:Tetrapyrrole-binding protein, chloroplastic [Turnera subulata]